VSLPPGEPGGILVISRFLFSRLNVNLRRDEPGGILADAAGYETRTQYQERDPHPGPLPEGEGEDLRGHGMAAYFR